MGIITNLASADMDFTQLEAFLTSQRKKRQVCTCVVRYKYGENNIAILYII